MPQGDVLNGETGSCLNEAAAGRSCVVDVVGGHGPWQFRYWAIFFLASLCCSLHLFSTLPLAHSSPCTCAESKNGSSAICNISNCSTRENAMKWKELREPCFTPRSSPQLTQEDACTNAGSVFYAKCLFAVGSSVSTFVSYPLMKRFGRRSVCLTSCFLLCSCSVAGVWASAPAPFLLLKLVVGAALVNVYLIAAFSLAECVAEEFRPLYFFTAHLSWGVAHFILPFLSWILPTWASFNLLLTTPCLLLLLALCFLPETAESYASRGLMSRAHQVMRHAARCNGFSLQGVEQFSPNLLLKESEDAESRLVWKEPRTLLQYVGLFSAGFLSTFIYLSMMWMAEWLPLKRASFFSLMGTSEVAASVLLLSLSYFVPMRRVWALTSTLSSLFLIIMYVKENKEKPKFSRGFHLVQMFFASASWTLVLVHVLSRPLTSNNRGKCLWVGAGICAGFLAATLTDVQKLSTWNPVLLLIMGAPNLLLAIFAALIPIRHLDGLNI